MGRHRFVEKKSNSYLIHLLWAELEFDIKFGIAKRGKLMNLKGEDAKNFTLTEDDEDWLLRQLYTAVGNVRQKIGWALADESRVASDELLDKPMEYNIPLKMDEGWIGKPENVMNNAHEYVVDYVLSEYMGMASVGGEKETAMERSRTMLMAKANEALDRLYDEINAYQLQPNILRL